MRKQILNYLCVGDIFHSTKLTVVNNNMDINHLTNVSSLFDISLTDLAFLIGNFRTYIKEYKVKDILEFLSLRKTKYREEIKETRLRNKLSEGLENYIKYSLKILYEVLSDENAYSQFMSPLNESIERKFRSTPKKARPNMSSYWTDQEISQLKSNLENILDIYNDVNVQDLFFIVNEENTKFKKDINLKQALANGLPERSGESAYAKMKDLLSKDNSVNNKKWTEEEIEKLSRLVKQFGKNWILIGQELNRLPHLCMTKHHNSISTSGEITKTGSWTQEECKRLRKAICTVMNVPKYTFVVNNIPWTKVSELVRTRSPIYCSQHWLYTFCCIKQDEVGSRFNNDIFQTFVNKIKKSKADVWKSIDWKTMWQKYDKGQFTPSPSALASVMRRYFVKFSKINPKHGTTIQELIKKLKIKNKKKVAKTPKKNNKC